MKSAEIYVALILRQADHSLCIHIPDVYFIRSCHSGSCYCFLQ